MDAASFRQVSDLSSIPTQSTHRHDQMTSREGVATHDGGQAIRDLDLPNPQTPTGSQTSNFVRPTVQRSMTVSPDIVEVQPERSRTMPLPSTSYMNSPVGNVISDTVPDPHPARLRDNSLVPCLFSWLTYTYPLMNDWVFQPLARTPLSQPTGPTHLQAHSQSSKCTSASGSADAAQASSEPMEIDIDLPTLDFRALTLNQTPSSHLKTATRTHSPLPVPSSSSEDDDEIEELDGPPSGRPPPAGDSLPLQPAPTEPRLLPVLAAEDPRMLAMLERHEQREAARPRQGMHKAPAVRRAGAKRGGFVLVAAERQTEAQVAAASREPRGVFAAYFARS